MPTTPTTNPNKRRRYGVCSVVTVSYYKPHLVYYIQKKSVFQCERKYEMIIYIENEMIINTDNVSCIRVEKFGVEFRLVASGVGEKFIIRCSDDFYDVQNDLNNIMHHIYSGTKFLDLNENFNYRDISRQCYKPMPEGLF